MTYFGFLIRFLVIPLIIFLAITGLEIRQRLFFRTPRAVWLALGLHVLLAVVYTTPWDNYLVASKVWSYTPFLVSGLMIGWVPVEEYTFFILETLLTGLFWWFLARRIPQPAEFQPSRFIRIGALVCAGLLWLMAVLILILGWRPGTYLALILAWALPAIAPQLAFGADILWQNRKLVGLTIFPLFIYLSGTDTLAIASGTWKIDLAQSTGIFLWRLPIEEALFFGITVMLITFGLTLALSPASQTRWKTWLVQIQRMWQPTSKRKGSSREYEQDLETYGRNRF
jgi:lycopene cyclase domain-containing protein